MTLRPGKTTLGRMSINDIAVDDNAASRAHAEIYYDDKTNIVTIADLGSTNGTYVNRARIIEKIQLHHNDVIRIGQVVIVLTRDTESPIGQRVASGTHLFTRELVLESLDQHSVTLFDLARKLNFSTSIESIDHEVSGLLKRAVGVENCRVVPVSQFNQLGQLGYPEPHANLALHRKSAEVSSGAMFVPILGADDNLIGLLCMKRDRHIRTFDRRDLQMAVAASYHVSLALQRIELVNHARTQDQIQQLLRRFIAPQEADYLLNDYLSSGNLPELAEQNVTVMFSDIADSTSLAERIGTRQFAAILRNYYHAVTEIIFEYGGIVRYLGDGIMAVFLENPSLAPHAERGVKAGMELVARLNVTGALDERNRYIIGVSINTGAAMVGYVGTDERAEFVTLGDTVNVAFRLQEYARPYRVVIGPGTMEAVGKMFKTRKLGTVTVKGRLQPVNVNEVTR